MSLGKRHHDNFISSFKIAVKTHSKTENTILTISPRAGKFYVLDLKVIFRVILSRNSLQRKLVSPEMLLIQFALNKSA